MSGPYSHPVVFAFANNLPRPFPIDCTVGGETWSAVRKRIAKLFESTFREELSWDFYRPGRKINRTQPFYPTNVDHDIDFAFAETIHPSDLASADSGLQIVIVINSLVNPVSQMTMKKTVSLEFPTGLPYVPPKPGRLVNSVGVSWDYQASDNLVKHLRKSVGEHYHWFSNGYIDKWTMPLYLFLSGAGTGKSRNSVELHNTILKCFDGTYGDHRNQQLAQILKDPLVFHVTLENGQSPQTLEDNPMGLIGYRMLHQLIGGERGLSELIAEWKPPDPEVILRAVERWNANQHGGEPRAVFLVVDGLKVISTRYGKSALTDVLLQLGGLACRENSFRIVCATSRISGPIYKIRGRFNRKTVVLPCSLIKTPTIQGVEVFRTAISKFARHCGGHGRALECMSHVFQTYPQDDSGPEITNKGLKYIMDAYRGVIPSEGGEEIFMAATANRLLHKYKPIPGTEITPDELCERGLVTFESDYLSGYLDKGYLRVSYIWVLIFARLYRDSFEEIC
ncbi:uncharacterized protein TRUGW13939_02282 [Talaromyces rugulosus]|uniref:Crinkler effector protein N-terminal domain-containing protein n=1 Tax=Talaromyces rugulosus TaxID=121627 RepID=A0A7H8QMP1_TALRU|nr:uncharacterized protein TRUGW13939_02282 [Talaromyces rugulosus]QKX55190.1 hypothetical protein TRUGW13939_02282 [Talaromyces rugulosus]